MFNKIIGLVIITISLLSLCCKDNLTNNVNPIPLDTSLKVIFVELGSVSCIPCQKMRPIMDSIQKKYGSQILVKFIDIYLNPQEAEPYQIKVMPTQVFLDSNKVEFFRHRGFYPEDSIHVLLQSRGLKIIN